MPRIFNLSICDVASIPGYVNDPHPSATIVAKGTFRIVPDGTAEPIDPGPGFAGVTYATDDRDGEVLTDAEFAPKKGQPELIVKATAHAPGGEQATAFDVDIALGELVAKRLRVFGPRPFSAGFTGRSPGQPEPFTECPIRWSEAYGGPGYAKNPAGKGTDGQQMPRVESPAAPVRSPNQNEEPAGFGPMNISWPQRTRHLGTYGRDYLANRWPRFPADFDYRYFNAAPPDQSLKSYPQGDELFWARNLHPEHEVLRTHLPAIRVRAFLAEYILDDPNSPDGDVTPAVAPPTTSGDDSGPGQADEPGAERREIELHIDTVVADLEAGTISIIWRGHTDVREPDLRSVASIRVVHEPLASEPSDPQPHLDALIVRKGAVSQEEQAESEQDAAMFQALRDGDPVHASNISEHGVEGANAIKAADEAKKADAAAKGIELGEMKAPDVPGGDKLALQPSDPMVQLMLAEPEGQQVYSQYRDVMSQYEKEWAKTREMASSGGTDVDALAAEKLAEGEAAAAKAEADPVGEALAGLKGSKAELEEKGVEVPGELEESIAKLEGPEGQQLAAGLKEQIATLEGAMRSTGDPEIVALLDPAPPPSAAELQQMAAAGKPISPLVPLAGVALAGLALGGIKLKGAVLAGTSFAGTSLKGAALNEAVLTGANLRETDLTGADLREADFTGADLTDADLTGAVLDDAVFDQAILTGAIFDNVHAHGASFLDVQGQRSRWIEADLTNAAFQTADLTDANFTRATIAGMTFEGVRAHRSNWEGAEGEGPRFQAGTDLTGSRFVNVSIPKACMSSAIFESCDFSNSMLERAQFVESSVLRAAFRGCRMRNANFQLADAKGAIFHGAHLYEANFQASDLRAATFDRAVAYGAEFAEAATLGATFIGANLGGTKLEGKV